ncbi:hypothetical protein B0T17DRAFT_587236 [Bombardia bombarda]|uniref:Ubiquitin carboxyl-terminal hydrolase n=1 Tax=Bombardia bombarda TaxID=252184 RepID=A0AA39XKV9_9PEZI|nr:hypothetical protein B0T17DRAFT_587236 [Bombardia bombarda]
MGPGPGGPAGPGANGGPRRGGRHHHYNASHHYSQHQYQHQHQVNVAQQQQPIYPANYMTHYPPTYYVPQPPHYQTGPLAASYLPYPPASYPRSPPTLPPAFVPNVYQVNQRSYPPRLAQTPPVVVSPYAHPNEDIAPGVPPPLPIPQAHTPSSTLSYAPPPVATPPVSQISESVPVQTEALSQPQQLERPADMESSKLTAPPPRVEFPTSREPFKAPLPWYSVDPETWPSRTAKLRRRRKIADSVELPLPQYGSATDTPSEEDPVSPKPRKKTKLVEDKASSTTPKVKTLTLESSPPRSETQTPSTLDLVFEDTASTSPTTSTSVHLPKEVATTITIPAKTVKAAARSAIPVIPVVPAIPKASPKATKSASSIAKVQTEAAPVVSESAEKQLEVPETPSKDAAVTTEATTDVAQPSRATESAWKRPKGWAALFSKPDSSTGGATAGKPHTNGDIPADGSNTLASTAELVKSATSPLAEVLRTYRVGPVDTLNFLEPRGLENQGNTCYINSVLQVLVFSVPFYDLIDQIKKKGSKSFRIETPLIDAMVDFMGEFRVMDSAASAAELRRRLKPGDLEKYGGRFAPEEFYKTIRGLENFASMPRGQQQDAEEFLGKLLNELHEECLRVMKSSGQEEDVAEGEDDWSRVGSKQKTANARESGEQKPSPITRIFNGRVLNTINNLKEKTVTKVCQAVKPLQLDIDRPDIITLEDALNRYTRLDAFERDKTTQTLFEALPPVLIIQFKRFKYTNKTSYKLCKHIEYPMELVFPAGMLSPEHRIISAMEGLPRYQLTSVVYHIGGNANTGHYTVDVRRQDGHEWIHFDDDKVSRLKGEDVARSGAVGSTTTLKPGGKESAAVGNRFAGIKDGDSGDKDGWKQAPAGGKKSSSATNGNTTPSSAAESQNSSQKKDTTGDREKVAYLLFYQRV